MPPRRQKRECDCRGDHRSSHDRRTRLLIALQAGTGVGNNKERKAGVPENVEPCSGLRTGVEQSVRCKYAWKRKRMDGCHQRRKKITAGKQAERFRMQDA